MSRPTGAQAKTTPPDWTGFYALAEGKDLEGFTPVNLDLHPVIVAHLQPWAVAKMEATDGIEVRFGRRQ